MLGRIGEKVYRNRIQEVIYPQEFGEEWDNLRGFTDLKKEEGERRSNIENWEDIREMSLMATNSCIGSEKSIIRWSICIFFQICLRAQMGNQYLERIKT